MSTHAATASPASTSPELADLPAMMKTREVAEFLRCDLDTVYALIREGHLPAIRLGSAYRVSRDALERFLAESEQR